MTQGEYDVAKYARKAAEISSLYKKCDGGGHFLPLQDKFFL